MDLFDSILLGIIQGLTEFLPVSSSGHLEIAKTILGDKSLPKESLLMTLVLHGATALSTIVVFRNDIKENIFNYGYLLENASEIHIMESSIRQIIEVLKIKDASKNEKIIN